MAKVIIGLDKGHGEISAFLCRIDSGTVPESLALDQNQEKVIPSAIAYDGETFCIGHEATKKEDVICYFKTAPSDWTDGSGALRKYGSTPHNVRDLMFDEISMIYKRIMKYNFNDGLQEGDEVFLYVGCPSAATWTSDKPRKAYQKLVSEATGLKRDHVCIVAESRAAIFSSFMDAAKGLKADGGVAVFDFGSSTADFTYIRTGELMLERSWNMGASEIEKIMLRLMLEQEGLTTDQIWQGNLYNLYMSLRVFKERYYSGKMGASDAIILMPYLADGAGERIPTGTGRTGKPRYKQATLMVQAGDLDGFMDEVTGNASLKVTENDELKGYYTWESGCEEFMKEMYALIKSQNQPCKAVVLTGGASKMDFVHGIAKRIFTEPKIYVEDIPSITVARGLCVVGKTDMEVGQLAQDHIVKIMDKSKERLDNDVIVGGAAELSELAFQEVLAVLGGINETLTLKGLNDRIKQGIDAKLDKKTVGAIIMNRINGWQAGNVDDIKDHIGKAVERLYNGLIPVDAIALDGDLIRAVVNDVNINVDIGQVDFAGLLLRVVANIVGAVVGVIVTAALYVVLCAIPIIGPLIAAVVGLVAGDAINEFIARNPNKKVSANNISSAITKLKNEKTEKCREMQQKIEDQLRKSLDPGQLTAYLPEAVFNALDIAALKSFKIVDNCPKMSGIASGS